MPESIAAEFKVKYLQVLDEKGNIDKTLEPKISNETLLKIYKTMVLTRTFDEKAIKLQRTGKLATYAPSLGEEAAHIASTAALEKEDMVFPSYRQHGAYLYKGFPMDLLYLYWKGHENGMTHLKENNVFSVSIPVGSQALHAVGYAYASNLLGKTDFVSMVFFGDGATSEGEIYEAMNFAGVFNCKTIFFNHNNQYAISVPREKQTKAQTLAQKAIAAGINCIQVDGNDFLAVYKAVKEARELALSKAMPTMIEAITYRLSMHTTADDPTRYRKDDEVQQWLKKDPIKRARLYLESKGLWNEDKESVLKAECEAKVNESARKAEEMIELRAETLFEHLFKEMTPDLKEQLEYLKKFMK